RRRRQADLSKLDAMQHYAYAKGCRRGFVLRYFGDPAARRSCDGCDNCLGTHRESATPARNAARAARPARSAPDVAAAAPVLGDELSPADATLVASLRGLRGTIARTEQLPAYCVFKDRTLIDGRASSPFARGACGAERRRTGQTREVRRTLSRAHPRRDRHRGCVTMTDLP